MLNAHKLLLASSPDLHAKYSVNDRLCQPVRKIFVHHRTAINRNFEISNALALYIRILISDCMQMMCVYELYMWKIHMFSSHHSSTHAEYCKYISGYELLRAFVCKYLYEIPSLDRVYYTRSFWYSALTTAVHNTILR